VPKLLFVQVVKPEQEHQSEKCYNCKSTGFLV